MAMINVDEVYAQIMAYGHISTLVEMTRSERLHSPWSNHRLKIVAINTSALPVIIEHT